MALLTDSAVGDGAGCRLLMVPSMGPDLLWRQAIFGIIGYGIALDVPSGKMYWTDYVTGMIRRANLDGFRNRGLRRKRSRRPVRLDLRSFDLDLAGGKMYWSRDQGSIYRANFDTTEFEEIVPDLAFVSAIAVDPVGKRMYWIDDAGDAMQSAKLDGSDIQTVTTSGLAAPCGLAVDPVNWKLCWTHFADRD